MPFLRSTIELIQNFLKLSTNPSDKPQRDYNSVQTRKTTRKSRLREEIFFDDPDEECEKWLGRVDAPQKRKFEDDAVIHTSKRGKLRHTGDMEFNPDLLPAGQKSQINHFKNEKADRDLMPPPKSPSILQDLSVNQKRTQRTSLENVESASEAQTQKTRTDIEFDYDMEAARRKAAATQLPANSGIWESAEQDLFYHLAYRGFEPLIPRNWMLDFGTLPLSLFANEADQTPLIEFHRSTEFRAIKALRDLIDTGKIIRDRVIASDNELRSEPIIEKAAHKYIKWSLQDAGISKKQCVPVHAIASMKPGQTTHDVIRELTIKMHKHSARHRKECNILTSIERNDETDNDKANDETRLNEDKIDTDYNLPVIYGLMICSSLIAVFTLSSHTPPPRFVVRSTNNSEGPRDLDAEDETTHDQDDNEDSGLRFIASFDFSDSASDVWNAFVIAILAMMIRKSLLEIYEIPATGDEHDLNESVLESSLIDDETDDRAGRYVARYSGPSGARSFRANMEDVDDPDL